MHVLGISGSLRADSYNTRTIRAASNLTPDGVTMDTFLLHDIPAYNGDVEKEAIPAPVQALRDAVDAADAVVICTPEYNYSISGVLKNALDWLSRTGGAPLGGKPVAIMGASPGRLGTARAQYHLRQVLVHFDAQVLNKPEIMISGAATAFNVDGSFSNEKTAEFVQKQLARLIELA